LQPESCLDVKLIACMGTLKIHLFGLKRLVTFVGIWTPKGEGQLEPSITNLAPYFILLPPFGLPHFLVPRTWVTCG
jgi:hypothetical protein